MALTETLKLVRDCVRSGWNPEWPLAFNAEYELVPCHDVMADAPHSTRKPAPLGDPFEWCADAAGKCQSFTLDAAMEYACRKVGRWGERVQLEEFLDAFVPPVVVSQAGEVLLPGLVCIWEVQDGRTQEEVVELVDRAVRRATAMERG